MRFARGLPSLPLPLLPFVPRYGIWFVRTFLWFTTAACRFIFRFGFHHVFHVWPSPLFSHADLTAISLPPSAGYTINCTLPRGLFYHRCCGICDIVYVVFVTGCFSCTLLTFSRCGFERFCGSYTSSRSISSLGLCVWLLHYYRLSRGSILSRYAILYIGAVSSHFLRTAFCL